MQVDFTSKVYPGTELFPFTFVTILFIWYFLQINEVGGQGHIIHAAFIPDLDFDSPTEWREHFFEDNLLMPHRICTVLLHCCPALEWKSSKFNSTGVELWRMAMSTTEIALSSISLAIFKAQICSLESTLAFLLASSFCTPYLIKDHIMAEEFSHAHSRAWNKI